MPVFFDRLISLVLVALAVLPAYAGEPRWPTQQEIDGARTQHPMPSVEEIIRQPVPRVPKIEPRQPAIDIEGIARRYSENKQAFEGASSTQPTLMIFVTLAMPAASLRLIATQAARSGATIVIRGLKDDSMQRTLAAVKNVIGESKVAWQIDPPAFARFRVERAPTFVLVAQGSMNPAIDASCKTGCERSNTFVSVAGDVSLDYALEFIIRMKPALAEEAQRYLKRLRG